VSYEERDNSGSIFRVADKKGEKFPDYEGKAMIDGKLKWVSMWIKEGKKGKFYSIAFKDRDALDKPKVVNRARTEEDDIPW
jgi:hypothetical protein